MLLSSNNISDYYAEDDVLDLPIGTLYFHNVVKKKLHAETIKKICFENRNFCIGNHKSPFYKNEARAIIKQIENGNVKWVNSIQ